MWDERNNTSAKAAEIHAYEDERSRLAILIEAEFETSINGIRPMDQGILLDTTIEDVLKLSNKERQAWLNMVGTLRKRHDRIQQTSMSTMRTVMDRWINRSA